jgi:hypothetical protein
VGVEHALIIKYATNTSLDLSSNDPDPNEVVGVTGKESLTVCGPGKRGTLWLLGLVGKVGREVGFEIINNGPEISAATTLCVIRLTLTPSQRS